MPSIESFDFSKLVNNQQYGKSFLVGFDETEHGPCLTVHASKTSMSRQQSRHLAQYLRGQSQFNRCEVKRYRPKALDRARSLEAFLAPYDHDKLVFDPTGAFARAANLLKFAQEMRRNFSYDVDSMLWHGRMCTLYVVLDHSALPDSQTARLETLNQIEADIQKTLVAVCGAEVAHFVKGVRVGFHMPSIAATPIDNASLKATGASLKTTGSLLEKVKASAVTSALAALFGVGVLGAAQAEEPLALPLRAVSSTNSDIAFMGGVREDEATFLANGAVTVPFGERFGGKLEGTAGTSNNAFMGGAAAHLFWRNPKVGLFGLTGGFATVEPDAMSSETIGVIAAEGEMYFEQATLSGMAGHQFSDDDDNDGFVGRLDISWYASKDLLVSVGASSNPQHDILGHAGFEYRPGFEAIPGLSIFAEGAVGENNYNRVYGGIRIYFGASESLKDRHRYDTFKSHLSATSITDAAREYGS